MTFSYRLLLLRDETYHLALRRILVVKILYTSIFKLQPLLSLIVAVVKYNLSISIAVLLLCNK